MCWREILVTRATFLLDDPKANLSGRMVVLVVRRIHGGKRFVVGADARRST
jgi:hypothetical protein